MLPLKLCVAPLRQIYRVVYPVYLVTMSKSGHVRHVTNSSDQGKITGGSVLVLF